MQSMKKLLSLTLCSLGFAVAAMSAAGPASAGDEFSAEVVQRGPDGAMSSGKIYKGGKRTRTEMSHQGQQLVRITDEGRGVEWVLFPEQKKYMERQLTGQGAGERPSAENPCAGMPGVKCRKLGEESVGGRTAVKWEMTVTHQGKLVTATQWIDKERGPAFMLRQEMPEGPKMERELVGQESLDGRQTEKWKIVMTQPTGQAVSTFEWYDPQLELAIKQEFRGGVVSELRNIRVGEQPDHLFSIPAGYERVNMPQGAPAQPPSKP
jgi:hypothetical protein